MQVVDMRWGVSILQYAENRENILNANKISGTR